MQADIQPKLELDSRKVTQGQHRLDHLDSLPSVCRPAAIVATLLPHIAQDEINMQGIRRPIARSTPCITVYVALSTHHGFADDS